MQRLRGASAGLCGFCISGCVCAGLVLAFAWGCGRPAEVEVREQEEPAEDELVIETEEWERYEFPLRDEEVFPGEELLPDEEPPELAEEPPPPIIPEEEPDEGVAPAEDPRTELSEMGILFHKWAFIEAAGRGDEKAVGLFIEGGMDVNVINSSLYRETALMWAARGGHAGTVELLLEHGAEPDMRNSKDMTALGYARMFGHAETARVLREAGAER